MPEAKLTTKGQVTIPKEVRKALQVTAGDRVQFSIREDGVVELRPLTVDIKDLYGMIKHTRKPLTVEEMNAAIGDAAAELFERSVGK